MIVSTPQSDERLRRRLARLSEHDGDYWSFTDSRREHGHGLFQYPAMMVPQVARAVLKEACKVHPQIDTVGDPFAGSGTILTESMLKGLAFTGTDINPLAILLCRVKAGPFFVDALDDKATEILARIDADLRTAMEASFPNRDKWFERDVLISLSRIRRAILLEDSAWARRFFWICLADTVRLTSNSRTSTFKLHIRPADEIEKRDPDPIAVFRKAVTRNLQHMKDTAECLGDEGYLNRGHYSGEVSIVLGDTRQIERTNLSDIILTSPSYGDNATTVPYGQYSYLALQWMEFSDIDPHVDPDILRSTCEIDSRSLGGSKRVTAEERESLVDRSRSLKRYLEKLRDQPSDRAKRVTAFFRDLDACFPPILRSLRPGGLMAWTLGNRKVGGKRVPLDIILSELLEDHQAQLLIKMGRKISSKRMAPKNSVAETMSSESILVMRKAA